MATNDGARYALIDLGLMSDPKVVRLVRRQRDPQRTLATMSLYVATVLASWDDDRPIACADAVPPWAALTLDETMIEDLVAVGLLSDDGSIPPETLGRWMAAFRMRRDQARAAAVERWERERSGAVRPQSVSNADAMRAHSERSAPAKRAQSDSNATYLPTYLSGRVTLPNGRARALKPDNDGVKTPTNVVKIADVVGDVEVTADAILRARRRE